MAGLPDPQRPTRAPRPTPAPYVPPKRRRLSAVIDPLPQEITESDQNSMTDREVLKQIVASAVRDVRGQYPLSTKQPSKSLLNANVFHALSEYLDDLGLIRASDYALGAAINQSPHTIIDLKVPMEQQVRAANVFMNERKSNGLRTMDYLAKEIRNEL